MNKTIDYYNLNANEFYSSTVNANMSLQYNIFEKQLFRGARILDCGCGSGRDTKHFLDQGYEVIAIDGSEELCKKASTLTGLKVRNMLFQNIDFKNEFDGVWACASLLHVAIDELPDVLKKIATALKENGVLYVSFKYGNFNGERNGRFFIDLNEKALKELFKKIPEFKLHDVFISSDVRPENASEKWLNAFCVKRNKK